MRFPHIDDRRLFDGLSILFLAAIAVLIGFIFQDYGVSTDEILRNNYGQALYRFFASGFKENRAQHFGVGGYYGGLFDLVAILLSKVLPFGQYETRHLLGAVVGWLGLVGCWRMARWLFDPAAGFFTLVLLAATPVYFNHMFINPKDLPFAVGYAWSLYLVMRCIDGLPKVPVARAVGLGVALGLTLCIKIPVAIVGLYLIAGIVLMAWVQHRKGWMETSLSSYAGQTALRLLLPAGALAYLMMIALWPWAWLSPILNPLKALVTFTNYTHWKGKAILDGVEYASDKIPAYYLPKYIIIVLPEITVALLAAGIGIGIWLFVRRLRSGAWGKTEVHIAVLLMAATAPVAAAIVLKSNVYSGMRQFLFVVPPLVVLAGATLSYLFGRTRHRLKKIHSLPLLALLVAYFVYHAWVMITLHPYQYIYYNALVGGVPGAAGKYEGDYWVTSYREATRFVIDQVQEIKADPKSPRTYRVFTVHCPFCVEYYLPKNIKITNNPRNADFYILSTRRNWDRMIPGKEILRISRQGMLLTVVKSRK